MQSLPRDIQLLIYKTVHRQLMSDTYREMCKLLEWSDDRQCLCGLGKMLHIAYNFRKYKRRWYFSRGADNHSTVKRLIYLGTPVDKRSGQLPYNY